MDKQEVLEALSEKFGFTLDELKEKVEETNINSKVSRLLLEDDMDMVLTSYESIKKIGFTTEEYFILDVMKDYKLESVQTSLHRLKEVFEGVCKQLLINTRSLLIYSEGMSEKEASEQADIFVKGKISELTLKLRKND